MASLVSSGPSCQKLHSFITKIRNCKSQAEQSIVVEKECASIRATFKDDHYRHRNIAKLMFVDLLGYSVRFGQMDCLKLLVSNFFFEKKIGYLALPVLFDKSTNLLMLATNTIKNDMISGNQYVTGSAVTCLANIGTEEMLEPLQTEIEQLVVNTNPTIRKKALILAAKYIRTQPHLATMYSRHLAPCLADRNHGTVISCLTLELALLDLSAKDDTRVVATEEDPFSSSDVLAKPVNELVSNLVNTFSVLIKLERELIAASPALIGSSERPTHPGSGVASARHNQYGIKHGALSVAEFDYQGLCDPFLQVQILRTLRRLIALHWAECRDDFKDLLSLVNSLLLFTEGYKNSALAVVQEALKLASQLLVCADTGEAATEQAAPAPSELLEFSESSPSPPLLDGPAPAPPSAEWVEALTDTIHLWLEHLLKHKDGTVKVSGGSVVLLMPAGKFLKTRKLKEIIMELLEDTDRVIQIKCVDLLRHISNRFNAVEITECLLNFLLVVSDPVPTASLREQPLGKDVQFSGRTAVVVQDSSKTSSAHHQINVVQTRLLNVTIDTLETLISSYAPTKIWEVSSLIRLTKLVGNRLTERSRVHMSHVLLASAEQRDSLLYHQILSQLIAGLKDNMYNAPLTALIMTVLAAAKREDAEFLDEGQLVLNLVETVMMTYGYGCVKAGQSKRVGGLALLDDCDEFVTDCGETGGVFANIALKSILSAPSSSVHEFVHCQENFMTAHPQVFLPNDTVAAAKRARLRESIVQCLVRTATTFPATAPGARSLLHALRERNTDTFTDLMITDYLVALKSCGDLPRAAPQRLAQQPQIPLGEFAPASPRLKWDQVERYTIVRESGAPRPDDAPESLSNVATNSTFATHVRELQQPAPSLLDDFLL